MESFTPNVGKGADHCNGKDMVPPPRHVKIPNDEKDENVTPEPPAVGVASSGQTNKITSFFKKQDHPMEIVPAAPVIYKAPLSALEKKLLEKEKANQLRLLVLARNKEKLDAYEKKLKEEREGFPRRHDEEPPKKMSRFTHEKETKKMAASSSIHLKGGGSSSDNIDTLGKIKKEPDADADAEAENTTKTTTSNIRRNNPIPNSIPNNISIPHPERENIHRNHHNYDNNNATTTTTTMTAFENAVLHEVMICELLRNEERYDRFREVYDVAEATFSYQVFREATIRV